MQFTPKQNIPTPFFFPFSNHIIFSFIWIKTANLHFVIFVYTFFFFILSSLKALFLSFYQCVYENDLDLPSHSVVIITYIFADQSDKNGFRRITAATFQMSKKTEILKQNRNKLHTNTHKRWLNLTTNSPIIDNFISWRNWFPTKIY